MMGVSSRGWIDFAHNRLHPTAAKNDNLLKMCSPSGCPRCRWVCFFIRFGEMLHSVTCSPMDSLQWMGAVRMTADKKHHNNPQVIHTSPVHQLTSWELKSCMFVRNKSIIKTFLTSNASSSEKVHLLLSSHIKIHQHICSELFWLINGSWSVHIFLLILTFSLEKAILLEDSYFSRKQWFEVKT